MSHLFQSDDQNTGVSASASVLPVNVQGWSPLRLTGLISLPSKGLLGVFSSTTAQRHQFFGILPSLWSSSHNHKMTTGKTIALTIQTLVGWVMPLLFNTLSRFVIAFLPRCKCLLISWLLLPSTVILEPKKRKYATTSIFPLCVYVCVYIHTHMPHLLNPIVCWWALGFLPFLGYCK